MNLEQAAKLVASDWLEGEEWKFVDFATLYAAMQWAKALSVISNEPWSVFSLPKGTRDWFVAPPSFNPYSE